MDLFAGSRARRGRAKARRPGAAFLRAGLLAMVMAAGLGGPAAAEPELVQARLLSEMAAAKPGTTAWVAVELAMKPGWHTYWRNPGDAGQATEIAWTLPPGFKAGAIHWPAPKTFTLEIVTSYGYEDRVALLVPIAVPATAVPGTTAALEAEVAWLACEKICIPGEAKLSLDLPLAAEAAPDPDLKAPFAMARASLPLPATGDAEGRAGEERITVLLPPALIGEGATEAAFLPFDDSLIEHNAPQALARGANGLTLTLKRGPRTGPLEGKFQGVLLVGDKARPAQRAYDLTVVMAAR